MAGVLASGTEVILRMLSSSGLSWLACDPPYNKEQSAGLNAKQQQQLPAALFQACHDASCGTRTGSLSCSCLGHCRTGQDITIETSSEAFAGCRDVVFVQSPSPSIEVCIGWFCSSSLVGGCPAGDHPCLHQLSGIHAARGL